MVYNLLEEVWIPVLYLDGTWTRVGIRKALYDAGRIRQIAASNPLDNVAILRFLLAVLLWCTPNMTDADRKLLSAPETEGVPDDWLKAVDHLGSPSQPNAAFNLLGEESRFYQDRAIVADLLKAKQTKWDDERKRSKSQKPPKTPRPTQLDSGDYRPIGDLLVEFPTETKIAHLRHLRDKEYGLCPTCCTLGIIRFSTFANAYGGGRYTAAINGPTPAYALKVAPTLLASLLANWPTDARRPIDQPSWSRDETPKQDKIEPHVVFSWRTRRLWLGDFGETDEICSYCGRPARLVKQLAFSGNWKPPFASTAKQKKFWDGDPHLILEQVSTEKEGSDDDSATHDDADGRPSRANSTQLTTLGFPAPGAGSTAHARFWRRALLAIGSRSLGSQRDSGSAIYIAGPAANKGLYQDAASLSLRQPLGEDVSDLATLSKISEGLLGAFRRATLNPQRQHPNRKAALEALSPSVEATLSERWNKAGTRVTESRTTQFQHVVQTVVSSTTPGSPLRRREALHNAQKQVRQLIERVTMTEAETQATDSQPRTNKKKGSSRRPRMEAKP